MLEALSELYHVLAYINTTNLLLVYLFHCNKIRNNLHFCTSYFNGIERKVKALAVAWKLTGK